MITQFLIKILVHLLDPIADNEAAIQINEYVLTFVFFLS
ncbi:hypothetical protein ABWED_2698 [Acinetobacter lwoffii]|nr:hypothetical protein ABVS_1940 [Acinetobacter lwoffii]UVB01942.1 hypothetical protein ABWED_2698 [Acinetobacter lwoffii]